MNKRNDLIAEWAIGRIEKEYKDEVSLLLTYGSYINGTATPLSDIDFYFIPKTERAYELSKTFIIEGIGFDLFPMSWERVEQLAELNESLTPCLADVKVLFCSSNEDKRRFEGLQYRLKKNLANPIFMLDKASQRIKTSMGFYHRMLFEKDVCEIRTLAGFIIMNLFEAVAYANQTYFSRGPKKQLEDLGVMKKLPKDFVFLYKSVLKANSEQPIKDACYKMIVHTNELLNSEAEKFPGEKKTPNYEDLAELYQEIISTWNKINACCEERNASLAYMSGVALQQSLDMASRKNGLAKFDLMSAYNKTNLGQFNERAKQLQEEFVRIIEENGVKIKTYKNVEAFLREN